MLTYMVSQDGSPASGKETWGRGRSNNQMPSTELVGGGTEHTWREVKSVYCSTEFKKKTTLS